MDISKDLVVAWRTRIASDDVVGTPLAGVDPSNLEISSSPVVVNGVVYIGSPDRPSLRARCDGREDALEVQDWRRSASPRPAVANGVVYIGSDDKSLHAVDAADRQGPLEVHHRRQDQVVASRGQWRSVYVGSYDSNLYALDATTGKVRQVYQTNGQIFTSPRIRGWGALFRLVR